MAYVSDELTHFVGRSLGSEADRFALLVQILRGGVLRDPSHIGRRDPIFRVLMVNGDDGEVEDGVEYSSTPNVRHDTSQALSNNSLIQFELVCFCDIPLSDIELHCQKYSSFGVAFKKPFLVNQGAAPVMYVPRPGVFSLVLREHHSATGTLHYEEPKRGQRSDLFDELFTVHNRLSLDRHKVLQELYKRAEDLGEVDRTVKQLRSLLFYQTAVEAYLFGHLKFFDPTLPTEDVANYYMEREWRVAGAVEFTLQDVSRVVVAPGYRSKLVEELPALSDRIWEIGTA